MSQTTPDKMRKPRADAKLKTLPPDQQALVFSWCSSGTLEDAVSRCVSELQPPVQTGIESMSQFRRWYAITTQNAEAWEKCLATAEADAANRGGKSREWVDEQARSYFKRRAVANDDHEQFVAVDKLTQASRALEQKDRVLQQADAKLAQAERALDQSERRVKLLEEKEAKAKDALGDATLTLEQRQARIREIFGVQ